MNDELKERPGQVEGIPAADLQAILDTLSENLAANQQLVTKDLLDQADQLLNYLGGQMSTRAAVDLPKFVAIGKQVVSFERKLIAGQGEQIRDFVDKLRNKPVLLAMLAKMM